MQKSYFNTTRENPQLVMEFTHKAKAQETEVLNCFKENELLSASEVWKQLKKPLTPLTSIRRAITVLKDKGKLAKTELRRKGIYGRSEIVWQII